MQLNVKTLRLDVEDTGPRQVRLERARDAARKVDFEIAEQDERLRGLESVRDDSTTPPQTMGQASLQFVLLALGMALVAVDAVVQFVVNSASISAVSPTTWLVASPFIAFGLGGITHGIAQALTFDPTRPQRAVRRCLRYAAAFGLACGIAFGVFLFGRTASEELVPYLVSAVSVSLWTLAEALPITGGLLSAAAHHMGYPAIHARRIRRVKERLAELSTFKDWLREEQDRLGAPSAAPPRDEDANDGTGATSRAAAASRSMSSLSTVGIVLVLLSPALTACRAADAQSATSDEATAESTAHARSSASEIAPIATSTPLRTALRNTTCYVDIDDSGSVNAAMRNQALMAMAAGVPGLLDGLQCRELRIAHFTNEGAFTPSESFRISSTPTRDCSDEPLRRSGVPVSAQLFDKFRAYQAEQDAAVCTHMKRDEEAAAGTQQAEAIAGIRRALTRPRGSATGCTAISPILDHTFARDPAAALIMVTDAAESCRWAMPPSSLPASARVWIVVVPSNGSIGVRGTEAIQRAELWRARYPQITVILFSELATWRWADGRS